MGFEDGLCDFIGAGGFQKIATGSFADGLAYFGCVFKDGEDDDAALASKLMHVA